MTGFNHFEQSRSEASHSTDQRLLHLCSVPPMDPSLNRGAIAPFGHSSRIACFR